MDRNRRPRLANRNKSTTSLRASVSAAIERLEERIILAATPLITEFLASNTNGLVDNLGRTSDWIEIYNPNSTALDLGGYFLTDDPNQLNKWQIPAGQPLGGNGYLVVFASGDDIAVPNQPLHTNFQISSSAGFLGMFVQAEGPLANRLRHHDGKDAREE